MNPQLIEVLRCPACLGDLELRDPAYSQERIEAGSLICVKCRISNPIRSFVPRFVSQSNYADNFGIQWNKFSRTQLDSFSGQPITRERFLASTGWSPGELAGKRVLDVGCGAGRFAEIALACGADVVALDYSQAVDACWKNHGASHNLDVIQADIYKLPFLPGQFDFVYCFGVLQHTPDVKQAFLALPRQLRNGGRLAVDFYARLWLNLFLPKYWLRPITKRLSTTMQFKLSEFMVRYLFPVSLLLGRVPHMGKKLRYAIPVANYEGILPLTPAQLREWSVLDTFDMLAPAHDHPQSVADVKPWFEEAGLKNVDVFRRGLVIGRATR